jgi:hypothetical protein
MSAVSSPIRTRCGARSQERDFALVWKSAVPTRVSPHNQQQVRNSVPRLVARRRNSLRCAETWGIRTKSDCMTRCSPNLLLQYVCSAYKKFTARLLSSSSSDSTCFSVLCGTTHLLKARSSLRSSSALLLVSEFPSGHSATLLQRPANLAKVASRKSCFVATPDSFFGEEGLQIRRRRTGQNEGVSYTSVPAIRTYRLFSRPRTYFSPCWLANRVHELKALPLITSVGPV